MAKTRKARKPTTHLQQHAFELISRHGERTLAMISMSFQNLGNFVPGQSQEDQLAAIEQELIADPRLIKTCDNVGRGGDWYGLTPNADDEDEADSDEAEELPLGDGPAPAVMVGSVMAEQSEPEAEEPASEPPSPVEEPKAPDDSKKDPTNGRWK